LVPLHSVGAPLTAGVALASIKLWLPFVHEAGHEPSARPARTSVR